MLWRYSRYKGFLTSYMLLSLSYLWSSPYTISRRYLKWQGAKDVYSYGETPLTVMDTIVCRVGLEPGCRIFEFGAGSGYTSLWLYHVRGCRVTAIDVVPGFIRRLGSLVKWRKITGITVRGESYLDTPLNQADCVYLYASNLDDDEITLLVSHLARLREGGQVITISYALVDYDKDGLFQLVDQFAVIFPWGEAEVFVQVRTSDAQISAC